MKDLLKKVVDSTTENNITISINTHRTSPAYKEDALLLKNKIREVETILLNKIAGNKSLIEKLINSLKKLAEEIDHSLNLESLCLFVNENIATYVRLSIHVEDRVSVSSSFIVRDAIRSLSVNMGYYILILSKKEAHLLEAFNDRPVKILGEPFPIVEPDEPIGKGNNRSIQSSSKETNIKENYFNKVSKLLDEVIKNDHLPVLVCAEESTYYEFMKVTEKKERIIGVFSFNYRNIKNIDLHITETAWPFVQDYIKKKNAAHIVDLENAVNTGNYRTDINEISSFVNRGRGRILFVKTDYFLSAIIENGIIIPIKEEEKDQAGVIDDIVSDFILTNIVNGGEVIFLPDNTLNEYNGLLLTIKNN